MTKTALARQILSIFKDKEMIHSFKIEDNKIDIYFSEDENDMICLNLNMSLSKYPQMIRDLNLESFKLDEKTYELYFQVDFNFYPDAGQNVQELNGIDDYEAIGKQLLEEMGKARVEKK